jgi:hypothetical protein
MDRDRVKDALYRRATDLARRYWLVRHGLEDLKRVAVLAAILVDGHGKSATIEAGDAGTPF